jgi:signal transduction histidine kinase
MLDFHYENANILIVDDQVANIDVLEGLLFFQGYSNIQTTTDPRLVVDMVKSFNPDLILLDLRMPYLSGYEVMEQLKEIVPIDTYLPILVLTADMTNDAKKLALSGGASDFLAKPFDLIEVGLRIKNLLMARSLHLQLQNQNQILEEKVIERTYALQMTNNELIAAKEKAEESNRLKTAFLNNLNHEIRTPFNGILGFLSILQEDNLSSSDREEFLEVVKESSNRLMNTINDIVLISQIHAGDIKPNFCETHIGEFIHEINYRFKFIAEKKGLGFETHNNLPENLDCINSDCKKLNIILSNLIDNALKFTKKGKVEIGIRDSEDSLEFYVKDTGIGISENKCHLIFERFIQADVSSSREFEGSGLGLSIAKAYVEMLGGKIWVESEVGKGSTFYFTLKKS